LYSAIESEHRPTEALVASGQDCLNRWVLRCRLKVCTVQQDLTSDGSEFQVCGAATEKDRRANLVRVFGTISSGALDDRRGRTGTAVWIRSFKYAGVEDIVLNVSAAILYVTRCLTASQWSDLRSGLASARPPRWQTTLARLFCSLHYIESCSWCAVEYSVTVVQPGTDNTARYCLS